MSSLSTPQLSEIAKLDDEKLLELVTGRAETKVRNLTILTELAKGRKRNDIAAEYELDGSRISHLVKANRVLLDAITLRTWLATKAGRVRELSQIYRERHVKRTKKDPVDIIAEIRKETEGESPVIQNNVTNAYSVTWDEPTDVEDSLPPPRETEGFSFE